VVQNHVKSFVLSGLSVFLNDYAALGKFERKTRENFENFSADT